MVDSQFRLINAATGKWTKDWFLCKFWKGAQKVTQIQIFI